MSVLRVLLPSWRFFDRAVRSPRLWIRRDAGEWFEVAAPASTPWRWAFAPASNLALAEQSAVEHLVAHVEELEVGDDELADDAPAIVESVPYRLVDAIAHEHAGGAARYQWKIVAPDGDSVIDFLLAPERAA
jgi:hypothetical protein